MSQTSLQSISGFSGFSGNNPGASGFSGHLLGYEFGDGSDGDVVLDGTTFYPFTGVGSMNQQNNFLTSGMYFLNEEIYCHNLTINAGQELGTNTCRIFVAGTLTNNGKISCRGGPGAEGGLRPANGSLQEYGHVTGPAGGNNVINAVSPDHNGFTNHHDSRCGQGGPGGGGFSGSTQGANGGWLPITWSGASAPYERHPMSVFPACYHGYTNAASLQAGQAGGGGGGGWSGAVNSTGGAEGNGGGYLGIFAYSMAGNGSFDVQGGSGASGTGWNAGGGGGGGGGGVIVVSANPIPTFTYVVKGGIGGAGVGSGLSGFSGTSGFIQIYGPKPRSTP